MIRRGSDVLDIDDKIKHIQLDPHNFKTRDGPQGELACRILAVQAGGTLFAPSTPVNTPVKDPAPVARQPVPITPFAPYTPVKDPGRVAKQPVPIELDASKLSDVPTFKARGQLGAEVYEHAPVSHHFSHLRVDHTLSGFRRSSAEETAVRLIYRHLMYESKPDPPCKEIPTSAAQPGTRGPFFTVREHNHKPPADPSAHTEVLIYGSTQLSKTPEACVTAWCAYFVDGCLPIIGVRNKGGANSGSTDMRDGIMKEGGLNERIENMFKWEVRQRNLALDESDYTKFLLHPRRSSNQEFIEFDHDSRLLTRPHFFLKCFV